MKVLTAFAIWLVLAFTVQPLANAQEPDVECRVPQALEEIPDDASGAYWSLPQQNYRQRLHSLATGKNIRVAVIDTGVSPHPDLPRVEAGSDLVTPSNPNPLFDCDVHGTIVAGIIGGQTYGIAPDVTIDSIRQTSSHYRSADSGSPDSAAGTLSSLADSIEDAINREADLINISVVSCVPGKFARSVDSQRLEEVLRRAESSGVLVVAAAGNREGQCVPGARVYPADFPTVITVAALESSYSLADYSLVASHREYPGSLLLSAPGQVDIGLSTFQSGYSSGTAGPNSDSEPFKGTSFAAPVITGTLALLLERYPDLSPAEIREILRQSADPVTGAVDPLSTVEFLPSQDNSLNIGYSYTVPASTSNEKTNYAGIVVIALLGVLALFAATVTGVRRHP